MYHFFVDGVFLPSTGLVRDKGQVSPILEKAFHKNISYQGKSTGH